MCDPLPPIKQSTISEIPIVIHRIPKRQSFLHKQVAEIFKLASQKPRNTPKSTSPKKSSPRAVTKNMNLRGTKKAFSERKNKSLETEDMLIKLRGPYPSNERIPSLVVKINGIATKPSRRSIFSKICKRSIRYKSADPY